jgi:hypothetical protein
MSNAIVHNPGVPRAAVSVRAATMGDLPFIDRLQKLHAHMVGWMPTQQLEGKIKAGHVIVAWASRPCSPEDMAATAMLREEPVGYCIGHDQYFKRDDVGIIYQMNVVPAKQRGLIGATLVRAMFDRAAYGCKLFCCWCAQDIEANDFWESLGFHPLAFRAGSRGKRRVHIFWQRRIRAGDTTTPYWFPSQTSAGSIREDRLVLPIPPGVHWRDAMPVVLPGAKEQALALEAPSGNSIRKPKPRVERDRGIAQLNGISFLPPPPPAQEKPKRAHKPKAKNDPKLVAAARELRDRWLERVNADPSGLESGGKYDVSRALSDERSTVQVLPATPALPAPAAA